VEERIEVIERVVDAGIDPSKLLIGTGSCAYPDTIALSKFAVSKGAGGVLILPPFYYKNLTDEGILAFYRRIVEGVDNERLRIYLYHFPKMTSVPFTLPLIQKLIAAHPGIVVGFKDSGGDWKNMKAICQTIPGFGLYAGTEKYLLPALRAGAIGCISASANATVKMCGDLYQQWESPEADQIQTKLTAARTAFESTSFVSGLKFLFSEWTGDSSWRNIRPPNVMPSPGEQTVLQQDLQGKLELPKT
jgi:4-hydroxy-tetrahydrodipicolinate synthase